MLKLILKDYGATWKQGVANAYHNSGFFIYFYLLLYPAIVWMGNPASQQSIYYVGVLGYLLTGMLSRMFSNRLEKTLYFCPIDKEQRKEYVRCAYWFRVLFPMTVLAIAELVMVVIGWIPFWSIFTVLVTVFCHGLTMNLFTAKKKSKETEWMEGWNVGMHLLGIVSILCSVMLQMGLATGGVETGVIVTVLAILLLLLILSLRVVKKYRAIVFEMAIHYEMV